jgi:phage baseplate assembly protein W
VVPVRDLLMQQVRADNYVDIQLGPNGDLGLLPGGDLALVDDIDALEQAIRWRLLTQLGSWSLEPDCGSQLHLFAGRPNNEITADELQAEIYRALGYDNFLLVDEVDVYVAPLDANRMTVIIMINPGLVEDRAAFQFEIDLITGELSGWQRI